MRCFVGCFVDPAAAEGLRATCPDVPELRWIPAQNYHVTLHFLGNVHDRSLPDLLAVVEDLAGQPTRAEVEALTAYPRPEQARVVVAQLSVEPLLIEWHRRLAAAWPTPRWDDKPFEPHVTLARSRHPVRLPLLPTPTYLALALGEPLLYRSETLPGGASYQPVSVEA